MDSPGLPYSETTHVYENILQTVGKTPLVRLSRIGRYLPCPLYAKIEFFNPGGSAKDHIALNSIEEAERSGRLQPGGLVEESTSETIGPEIWEQTTSSILLEAWKQGRIPEEIEASTYKGEGIGEGFLPGNLDLSVIDQVILVTEADRPIGILTKIDVLDFNAQAI